MTTYATGASTFMTTDGKAVPVALTATVVKGDVIFADGFLGIAAFGGSSGDTIPCTTDMREYEFTVPSGLTVNKGDTVWVDVTSLTGHHPQDGAYATSAGSNKYRLFRATAAKDSNYMVRGILLGGLGLL